MTYSASYEVEGQRPANCKYNIRCFIQCGHICVPGAQTSHKQHSYINNTLYGLKCKKILTCQKSLDIKIMFHEDISTVNISKHNYWLVICISKNLLFLIFRFFAPDFQILSKLSNKMTGFVVHGHIWRPVLQSLTTINTSFSVGTPTGRHPFVACRRLFFFWCLALAAGCFWVDLLWSIVSEPVFCGHSLAIFSLWSDRSCGTTGEAGVTRGMLGHPESGRAGGSRSVWLCSSSKTTQSNTLLWVLGVWRYIQTQKSQVTIQ